MSELYQRLLVWHKLVAMQTGGLSLCAAKRRLNKDEATSWSSTLRAVADDIDQFLLDGTFVLDSKGQRVSDSGAKTEPRPRFFNKESINEVNGTNPSDDDTPKQAVALPKQGGGLRVAKRKNK